MLPSVYECEYCHGYNDDVLAHLLRQRSVQVRSTKLQGFVLVGIGGLLCLIAVPASIFGSRIFAAGIAALGFSAGAAGARMLEDAKPYRQLRNVTDSELEQAKEEVMKKGLQSAGGAETSVAV